MSQRFAHVAITQIYGQTEIGIVASVSPWHLPAKLGACGRQVYDVEVAVVDPNGQPVATGEIGEVVSRGPNVMLGYYNDAELTASFFRRGDGWGWTGDLARMDGPCLDVHGSSIGKRAPRTLADPPPRRAVLYRPVKSHVSPRPAGLYIFATLCRPVPPHNSPRSCTPSGSAHRSSC